MEKLRSCSLQFALVLALISQGLFMVVLVAYIEIQSDNLKELKSRPALIVTATPVPSPVQDESTWVLDICGSKYNLIEAQTFYSCGFSAPKDVFRVEEAQDSNIDERCIVFWDLEFIGCHFDGRVEAPVMSVELDGNKLYVVIELDSEATYRQFIGTAIFDSSDLPDKDIPST